MQVGLWAISELSGGGELKERGREGALGSDRQEAGPARTRSGPNSEGTKMQSSLKCGATGITDEDTAAAAQRTALIEVSTKILQRQYTATLSATLDTAATWKIALIIEQSLDENTATAAQRTALEDVNTNVVQQLNTATVYTGTTWKTGLVPG